MGSPPFRLPRAPQIPQGDGRPPGKRTSGWAASPVSIVSLTNRTDPSAMATLTPPGCRLEAVPMNSLLPPSGGLPQLQLGPFGPTMVAKPAKVGCPSHARPPTGLVSLCTRPSINMRGLVGLIRAIQAAGLGSHSCMATPPSRARGSPPATISPSKMVFEVPSETSAKLSHRSHWKIPRLSALPLSRGWSGR